MCRKCIGTGLRAEQIAEQDRQAREQRRRQRKATERLEAELANAKWVIKAIFESSEVPLAASLLAPGFRHYKSQWRWHSDRKRKADV